MKIRMARRLGIALAMGLVFAPAVLAGHFSLSPVSATGGHVLVGDNEIRLIGGGQRLVVELHLSNWTPEILRGWQARVNAQGYANGIGAPLAPATVACASDATCITALAAGASCSLGACVAGFIDRQHPEWVFANSECGLFVAGTATATPSYRYFASAERDCVLADGTDGGDVKYGGTLVLDVPVTASGIYDVGFDESDSFMVDLNNENHALKTFARLRIVIVGDDNGDGAISKADHRGFVECLAGPQSPAASGCETFDFDGASTVDLADFADLQNEFTGP